MKFIKLLLPIAIPSIAVPAYAQTTTMPTYGGVYRTTDNKGNTSTTTLTYGGG